MIAPSETFGTPDESHMSFVPETVFATLPIYFEPTPEWLAFIESIEQGTGPHGRGEEPQ